MSQLAEARLQRLADTGLAQVLQRCRKGVEKEALRVTRDCALATTRHPPALGSALTNRYITTDFSEALLEFVTPAYTSTWETLQFLCDIHQFVYQQLDNELLWAASMPCLIEADEAIPVARYGDSNVGKMKTVYRLGLGHRYGRMMQTISGVHFNFSLPEEFWDHYQELEKDTGGSQEFRSASYFGLLRNVRRMGWLVLFLFGNSPAICKCFTDGAKPGLEEFDKGTFFMPYATSLRMSDLGYKNTAQAALDISLNNIDAYVETLLKAVSTPNRDFQKIGIKADGEYRQISANILQVENEYYGLIRPKRVTRSGEMPSRALKRRGVEYVELRALDVSLNDPAGINQNQMRFLEAFLIYCLIEDSPLLDAREIAQTESNQLLVARQGREPGLTLSRHHGQLLLTNWADEICGRLVAICDLLDEGTGSSLYRDALELQREAIRDPGLTPSAGILAEMKRSGESFFSIARRISEQHRDYFLSLGKDDSARLDFLAVEAAASIERQKKIEASDRISFEAYLQNYFSQAEQLI